jgi:hypothetical protein
MGFIFGKTGWKKKYSQILSLWSIPAFCSIWNKQREWLLLFDFFGGYGKTHNGEAVMWQEPFDIRDGVFIFRYTSEKVEIIQSSR